MRGQSPSRGQAAEMLSSWQPQMPVHLAILLRRGAGVNFFSFPSSSVRAKLEKGMAEARRQQWSLLSVAEGSPIPATSFWMGCPGVTKASRKGSVLQWEEAGNALRPFWN